LTNRRLARRAFAFAGRLPWFAFLRPLPGLAIVNLLKYARIALPETKKTGNAGGVDRRAPNASRRRKGDGGRVRSLQKYFALHYSAETRLEKGGTLPLSLSFFLFFSKTLAAAAFQTAALLRLSLFSLF
jgi:hypothetical protein